MSMTPENVVSCIRGCGLECAHMCFPKGSAPALPWAVYYLDETSDMCADGEIWDEIPIWVVEVYEKSFDPSLHRKVKDAIARDFTPPTVEQTWVEDENCLLTTYTFKEI